MSEFVNDPEYNLALALWSRYYYVCETYDRAVCSARKPNGTAIPVDQYEASSISAHAARSRRALQDEFYSFGISRDTSNRAKQDASRMSFDESKMMAERTVEFIEKLKESWDSPM